MRKMSSRFSKLVCVALALVGVQAAQAEVALPAGYSPLAWIASSGTQYIDTGASATPNTCIEASFHALKWTQVWGVFFGATSHDNSTDGVLLRYYNNTTSINGWFGNATYTEAQIANMAEKDVQATLRAGSVTANGVTATISTSVAPYTGNIFLFCGNMCGNPWRHQAMKLYSYKQIEGLNAVRDFVPCRNPSGEAGLWDKVEGKFYGNLGTGSFFGPDDRVVQLNWLESTGVEWINTGYRPTSNAKIEAHFRTYARKENWSEFFGTMGADSSTQAVTLRYYNNTDKLNGLFCNNTYGEAQTSANLANADVVATLEKGSMTINGEKKTITYNDKEPYAGDLYIFAGSNNNAPRRAQPMRLYSFKAYDGADRALVRDFVPARSGTGELGVYDRANGVFYPNAGTSLGLFTYGLAFEMGDSTTLRVLDGTLTAADLAGATALEKTGRDEVRFDISTLAVPFTLVSGKARLLKAVASSAPVTLTGGATLVFDVGTSANGAIETSSLAFSGADAAHPVKVEVALQGRSSLAAARALVKGANLTAGDLEKFALVTTGWPVALAIESGNLVLVPTDEPAETALPAGYTRLSYIASTGAEWIDTGVFPGPNTLADIRVAFPLLPANGAGFGFFGARAAQNNVDQTAGWIWNTNGTKHYAGMGGTEALTALPVTAETIYSVWLDKCGPCCVDGVPFVTGTGNASAYSCYLFAVNQANVANSPAVARLYSCVIRERRGEAVVRVRDFVPCRNPAGEAGLWDFVEGKFYGNQGTGRFTDEGDVAAKLNYIESTGTQYIDTLYTHTATTKVVTRVNVAATQPGNWAGVFGARNENFMTNAFVFFSHSAKPGTVFNRSGVENTGSVMPYGTDVTISCLENQASWPQANGTFGFITATGQVDGGKNTMFIFNLNTAAANGKKADGSWCLMKLYSLEISDGGTLERSFIPWRDAAGRVGLFDTAHNTFYPNLGTGAFQYGYAYNETATGITVYDGVVTAAAGLAGANIRKEGRGQIEMGAVTDFASLTVAQGVFSLANQVAGIARVAGTLTLAGGTVVMLDVVPGANDSITAGTVDLSGASVENPVTIRFVQTGETSNDTGAFTLIRGGLAAGDEAKFRVANLPMTLSVVDGALVATLPENIPYKAVWTGAGNRNRFSDPANWTCYNAAGDELPGVIPTADSAVLIGSTTTFNWPAGQTLAYREIIFGDGRTVTLAADCDWRGMDVPIDCTVDLNGHKLYLSRLNGTGTITDTSNANGYQRLEFIDSYSGAYINTGYKAKTNTKIEAHLYTCTRSENWSSFFGAMKGDTSAYGVLLRYYNNTSNLNGFFCNATYGEAQSGAMADTDLRVVLENGKMTLNGTAYKITTVNTPCDYPICIFGENNDGTPRRFQAFRLYSLKIYEGTTLVHDYVPARRTADGAGGLLDVVNGGATFLANASTSGKFLLGPVVTEDEFAATGELHLDVAEWQTEMGETLKLAGTVKLVKEGPGDYKPTLHNQCYLGGTEVLGGTVHAVGWGTDYRLGAPGNQIRVGEGGRLDMDGSRECHEYAFELDGGNWVNTTALASNWSYCQATTVRVTKDTLIDFNSWAVLGYSFRPTTLDLAGHTIRMNTQGNCYFARTTATRGTIVLNGPIEFYKGDFVGLETTLDVLTGPLRLNGVNVHIGTYIARASSTEVGYDGDLFVYKRFKPITSNFWGCILKNGAVLDLSACGEDWSLKGTCVGTSGTFTKTTASFEDGAQIGVAVGERRLRDGMRLVAWDAKPNAAFKLVDQPSYLLDARPNGLYCVSNGTILFVR